MRDYKFRAKAIEQFVDGDQWVYGFGVSVVKLTSGKSQCWMYTDGGVYEVDPETVGQYTGIKDKNGKEIYEGDIYHQGDRNILYVVVWEDTGLIGEQIGTRSYAGLQHWKDRIEIIGNRWDNPDLLGEVRER
ncbi:hypothetical protein EHV15_05280 [Paenibacillus oralis]|uniref:YopX protein domain-containing protein n=1 Tax=Paenibacillus oralis TaxID=2490856 RepID=A0A3P3TWC1_9BACL|nr:YopX family protein [Paenibacillus oralis]RRJ62427.1 hypothetical protein EHV15_05280 [Paenibacillus oralis]